MKKQKKIKAWIWLNKTEMPWISTIKPSKNEIENAKNFYVKILPCEIIIKEKQKAGGEFAVKNNYEKQKKVMKEEINWEKLRTGYEEVQMVQSSIENAYPEAYRLARKFHELYEQQAPFFGYITNPNSREFYPNSNNARLMAYVCFQIVKEELQKHNIEL